METENFQIVKLTPYDAVHPPIGVLIVAAHCSRL